MNGQKDGKGTIVWYTGDVYTGEWKNDNPHGQVIFFLIFFFFPQLIFFFFFF